MFLVHNILYLYLVAQTPQQKKQAKHRPFNHRAKMQALTLKPHLNTLQDAIDSNPFLLIVSRKVILAA